MRTAQELYYAVVTHQRKQGQKSYVPIEGAAPGTSAPDYICMYRDPNGNKCSIGCLIPDEDYRPDMEGGNLSNLLDFGWLPATLQAEFTANRGILTELQHIHDNVPIHRWELAWAGVAKRFNLKMIEP